ncbi:uncharacterized protein LOC120251498 [Dioscorea cayenensis subsp. rotundata]|uniref:Uncharacterized protein LOC120251498 n=1 Tax=Dioscorea cayennensis subsp. rotundata TaxID=55577 RepID=A0AB40AMG1_DIOCR|nr:uncharacterized protein LOC120251498 [Dioscorea cayenensis subsp. rotundata]
MWDLNQPGYICKEQNEDLPKFAITAMANPEDLWVSTGFAHVSTHKRTFSNGVAARMACSSAGNRCSRSSRGWVWCGRRGGVLWYTGSMANPSLFSMRDLNPCPMNPLVLLLPMMIMMMLINGDAMLVSAWL